MKKILLQTVLGLIAIVLINNYIAIRLEKQYYRGVWNTCLFGVVNQAETIEHAVSVCRVAYFRAVEQDWYNESVWPDVPVNVMPGVIGVIPGNVKTVDNVEYIDNNIQNNLSIISVEDDIIMGNTLPRQGWICTEKTPVYGNPYGEGDIQYYLYRGNIVRLHELGGEGHVWVMIEPAYWITLKDVCFLK